MPVIWLTFILQLDRNVEEIYRETESNGANKIAPAKKILTQGDLYLFGHTNTSKKTCKKMYDIR